jgi:CheY-like chemotaxis protein
MTPCSRISISTVQKAGVDLMRALPENKLDATPVLAVTAYAMPGDRETMLNAGFDGYLAKPFTKDQFLRAFARLFEQDGHQPPNAET